jgi:hypothetical protein
MQCQGAYSTLRRLRGEQQQQFVLVANQASQWREFTDYNRKPIVLLFFTSPAKKQRGPDHHHEYFA